LESAVQLRKASAMGDAFDLGGDRILVTLDGVDVERALQPPKMLPVRLPFWDTDGAWRHLQTGTRKSVQAL